MGVSIGVAPVFYVGRAKRSVHLNNDGSPLQTENDRACSNENNSKPLPSGWSFTEEQDRKDSNKQEA